MPVVQTKQPVQEHPHCLASLTDPTAPEGGVQIILDAYIESIRWGNGWAVGLAYYDSWYKARKEQGFAKEPPVVCGDSSAAWQVAIRSWVAAGR